MTGRDASPSPEAAGPAEEAADKPPLGSSVEPPPLGVGSSVELGAVLFGVPLALVNASVV